MKNLFTNIWKAPASTIAAGLVAAIGVIIAADLDVDNTVIIGLSALGAFLGLFSGPNKPGGGSSGLIPKSLRRIL